MDLEPALNVPLCYDGRGLITAVVQDQASKQVLMVAWMNPEALD